MKKIAILQSNYIPWKGYFDIIENVDEFIIYDEMQFTKNDWRNRNKIKTPQGVQWLTIPVGQAIGRRICDVNLVNDRWQTKHWKTLESNYRRAEFFEEVSCLLKPLYLEQKHQNLSDLNVLMIQEICDYIGITTKISKSQDYGLIEGKTERLVDLCLKSNASHYVSGPAAKDYLDEELFIENNIKLIYYNYPNYPEYPQLWGDFEHAVSIVDLLFHCGKDSGMYMKCLGSSDD